MEVVNGVGLQEYYWKRKSSMAPPTEQAGSLNGGVKKKLRVQLLGGLISSAFLP